MKPPPCRKKTWRQHSESGVLTRSALTPPAQSASVRVPASGFGTKRSTVAARRRICSMVTSLRPRRLSNQRAPSRTISARKLARCRHVVVIAAESGGSITIRRTLCVSRHLSTASPAAPNGNHPEGAMPQNGRSNIHFLGWNPPR